MTKLSREEALKKIQRYCAYQERSHQDVREKLYQIGAAHADIGEILSQLIVDGYLSEERFAKAFASGKFRLKKWGRIKIVHALEQKGVSKNCIKAGLKEIDQEDYLETLDNLLNQKNSLLTEDNLYVRRDRLSAFVMQKGFEPELVWEAIRKLFPDPK